MSIQILMPALSPTMTEGKLATWMVKEGESVSAGDVIAEIETDKATMEVEAVDEGIIGKILVDAGTDNVAVNTPIAVLLEDGEDASARQQRTGCTGSCRRETAGCRRRSRRRRSVASSACCCCAGKRRGKTFRHREDPDHS